MIRFEHTEYLWLLAGVAFLGILWGVTRWMGRQRRERWANREMWGRLIPDERKWRPITKTVLVLLGLSLIVVALANPLMGIKQENGKRSGSDIAICIDVSNSMMAEDVKPNRLARSKQVVNNLLNSMTGDRVSLIVFAGTSFIEMPLTNDYNAAKLFLDHVDCSMISTQGTAIGDAIENAMATFGYGDKDREWTATGSRAIIVISDGENHEDDAIGAAKEAAKQGVRVCAIGLGSTKGARIPGKNNGTYLRDHNGNIITTRLNEQMMKDISNAGKGAYVNGSNGIKDVTSLLESLEKNDFDEQIFNSFESRYQYPLAAGLLCLLIELLIFERRNKKWRLAFMFFFLFLGNAYGQGVWQKNFNRGNHLYRQQQYLEAADQYRKVLEDSSLSDEHRSVVLYNLGNSFFNLARENGDSHLLEMATNCYDESLKTDEDYRKLYNLGNALYLQDRYLEAAEQYNRVLNEQNLSDAQRSQTMYNAGNCFLKEAQKNRDTATLKTAISCYRNALRLDPANDDCRYNQTLAYRLLDKWSHKDRQQKKKDKKKEQQQQQEKQQQNKQQQQDKQQQKQQGNQKNDQQKKEQKKQNDSKKLNDEMNKELQRQQQKKQQNQQQNDKQKGQGEKGKDDRQQNAKPQNDSQQNNNQGQNQKQEQKQGQGKDAKKNQQQKKADKQKLNDEIKKEIERQKQKEKNGKDGKKDEKKKDGKKNGEQKSSENNNLQQKQMSGNPQTGKKSNNKQASAQQGTILTGKKVDPDKKNAEALLEAVKNNERKTLKTQTETAQPVKGYRIEKEW